MFNINSNYKRCPRCSYKTFKTSSSCEQCGLNFSKFNQATNQEGVNALKRKEKERVVFTKQLPADVNKWELFLNALILGWFGVHLVKYGRFGRAFAHYLGLFLLVVYYITYFNVVNNFWFNVGRISGAFGLIVLIMVIIDIFEILFDQFKVPVSLPYKNDI